MTKAQYLQDGFGKCLSHLVEECGETLAAAGKLQRWGPHSVNPELPPADQETNLHWLKREMLDLQLAMDRLNIMIEREFGE